MILLYLLISAMPLTRDPLWEHFMSDLTAIKYLGLACLLYSLAHCALARRGPALWATPQARWMQVLCLWAAVSWLFLGAPIAWDQSPLLSYVSFFALLAITLAVADSWPRLEHVLWALLLAVALASLYILREWQKYHAVYADFRPGWVTGDPNYFTASALLGLPLALAFSGRAFSFAKRWLARSCALVSLLAIGLAASRGGLLGLGAMLSFYCWKKRRFGALILAGCLALPPLLLWSNSPLNRLLHPTASDNKSTDTRLALWQAGLHMVADHPVTGIGLGNFKVEVQEYAAGHANLDHIAHNLYLELAAEMGLPALAAYLLMIGFANGGLARVERAAGASSALPNWLAEAALGLRTGLLGFSVSAFFLSAQYTKLLWLVIAISSAIQAMPGILPVPVPALSRNPVAASDKDRDGSRSPWPEVVSHA